MSSIFANPPVGGSQWFEQATAVAVCGHLVTELVDRYLPVGEHACLWRGADGAGRAVPAGSYFFCVETAGHVATGQAVLVK